MIANSRHVFTAQNQRFQRKFMSTRSIDLKTLWRPYLILMKVLGLLDLCGKNSKWGRYLWFFYALGSLIFLITSVMFRFWRCKGQLQNLDSLVLCVADSFWIISVIISKVTFFVANYHKSGLRQFFDLWSPVTFPHKYADAVHRSLKRNAYIMLVVVFSMLFMRNFVFLLNCLDNNTISQVGIFELVFVNYMIILDVAGAGYFSLTCYAVGKMYTNLNHHLRDGIANNEFDIELFCNAYHRITEWMMVADNCLKYFTGSLIFLSLIGTASQTYMAIKVPHLISNGVFSSFINIYWIFDGFLLMVVICYIASTVHTKAHSSLGTLSKAPTWQLSLPLQNQALSMQVQLSTTTVGFSLFGVQIITKAFLPTLISGFASYVFLLIQFRQPNSCSCFDVANDTTLTQLSY